MIRWTPQLTDRLLMGLGRQAGPAVDTSAQDAITESSARDYAVQKRAENAQGRLGLAEKGLAQNKEMAEKSLSAQSDRFQKSLDFDKQRFSDSMDMAGEEMAHNKRAGNWATGLSVAGLGLQGLGTYKEMNRLDDRKAAMDQIIKKYQDAGTAEEQRWAEWVKLLRVE